MFRHSTNSKRGLGGRKGRASPRQEGHRHAKPRSPDKESPSSGHEPHVEPAQPEGTLAEGLPQESLDKVPEEPSAASPSIMLVEHPVYFVSTVLRDARERYTMQQKLLLAHPRGEGL